ncbi:hypothetical protein ACLBR5_17140 [Escherichia coli]
MYGSHSAALIINVSDLISAALQFNACRESRTAQPGNTKLMNALD